MENIQTHPVSEKEMELLETLLHSYWTIKESFRKSDPVSKALAISEIRKAIDEFESVEDNSSTVSRALMEIEKSEQKSKSFEEFSKETLDNYRHLNCIYPFDDSEAEKFVGILGNSTKEVREILDLENPPIDDFKWDNQSWEEQRG